MARDSSSGPDEPPVAGRRPQFAKPCHMVQINHDQLFAAGRPATAVRFGNRPAPSVGRHLTGQKGLGRPLRIRPLAVFFYGPQDRGDLRPATCELRSFFIACMRYRRGRPKGVPPRILCIARIYDEWLRVVI